MPLLKQDQALELARRVLELSPADETEVTLESTEDRFARFADSGPTQSADRERYDLAVRVRLATEDGYREARATCGSLDENDARAAIERAMQLARVSEPDAELPPLGGPVQVAESAAQRPTRDHTFREKQFWISAALAACREAQFVPAGLAQTSVFSRTIVNSAGREVHGERARASFALTVSSQDLCSAAGAAEGVAANVESLDTDALIARAVEKAQRSQDARALPPGEYTVVLEPAAVSSLILFPAYVGFGAQEVHEQRSLLCGRVGEPLFPADLELVDDAENELCPGWLFDGEGTPRRRVALIEAGAFGGPVTDARWARKLGMLNTGHAQPQPATMGPSAQNLCLRGGDESLEELIGGVDRGLLISQFHYTNVIETKDMTLTGMTRNGTFLIENGTIAGPVQDLRFTQSLVEALQRVSGIGRDREVAGALFEGEVLCPALRIDGFRFTSGTEFSA